VRAKPSTNVTFEVVITLSEVEARALDALFGYGADALLAAVYSKLGSAYLKPYEKGVYSLGQAMRGQLGARLVEVDEARHVLRGDRVAEEMRRGAYALAGMILLGEAVKARAEESKL